MTEPLELDVVREAMEGLGGPDLYPDGNGQDDLSEMKKDFEKKQKAKK